VYPAFSVGSGVVECEREIGKLISRGTPGLKALYLYADCTWSYAVSFNALPFKLSSLDSRPPAARPHDATREAPHYRHAFNSFFIHLPCQTYACAQGSSSIWVATIVGWDIVPQHDHGHAL
jgi:hypothetical protein